MSKEELPQLFEAIPAHAEELDAIQGQGDAAYAQYMDNLAEQVIETGGVCDETTFLRSFFARCQRDDYGYSGNAPKNLRKALAFTHWLQTRARTPIAKVVEDKHVGYPRVLAKPSGIVLPNEYDSTTVVSFDIEKERGDLGITVYTGYVSFDALWTPNDPRKRRVEDISDKDVDEHNLIVLERESGATNVTIIEVHDNDFGMGIVLGNRAIDQMKEVYRKKSDEVYTEGQCVLRAAGRMLGLTEF
jgi:hypothetical protein